VSDVVQLQDILKMAESRNRQEKEKQDKFDEALIEAVREFQCLWKHGETCYKDLVAKENSCSKIAEKLSTSVADCQKRWKYLRDRYVKEHKKVDKMKSWDPDPPTSLPGRCLSSCASYVTTYNTERQMETSVLV
jgi:DNA replication protein DnaC